MSFPTKPLILIPTAPSFEADAHFVVTQGGADRRVHIGALPSSGFDVKAYGAISTGLVECSEQIQNCINACAAAGGGTVYFPPGTYLTDTPVQVPANVRLIGYYATIISTDPTDGAKVQIIGSNVIIEGLGFDGIEPGTSPDATFTFGLVECVRNNASAWTGIKITRCSFRRSTGIGVRLVGNLDAIDIEHCKFSEGFIDIFAEGVGLHIYKNLRIRHNEFYAGWFSGIYSGAVKLKSTAESDLYVENVDISFNFIRCAQEMGIEIWNGFRDSVISFNQIYGPDFGISVNLSRGISVIGNKTWWNDYAGIEIAEGSTFCFITDNTVEGYAPGTTTRDGNAGIITSGSTRCSDNVYVNNTVRGVVNEGFALRNSDRTSYTGGRIEDCGILTEIKNSSFVKLVGVDLYGPCGFHFFLNASDENVTDIDILHNTLKGAAADNNIIFYDGAGTHTMSNVRTAWNQMISATVVGLSFNRSIPDARLPNLQCHSNYFIEGAGKAAWPDFTTNTDAIAPFSPSLQRAGISTAAKTSFAVPSNAAARWVKVASIDFGNVLYLEAHFVATNASDGDSSAVSVVITVGPYGNGAAIAVLPNATFGSLIEEVIVDNDGATSDVWLKLKATPSKAWTIDCHFSDQPDGAIASPTLTTTGPTWGSNHYSALVAEFDRSQFLQARGFYAQGSIVSAPRASIAPGEVKGRLHVRGAGTEGGTSGARVAYFATDAGAEALGVKDDGEVLTPLGLSVGSGPRIHKVLFGDITHDFGTIAANSSASWGVYVANARANKKHSIAIGLPGLPDGVILSRYHISADDTVDVVLRNITGSGLAVGDIWVTATVLQFEA